MENRTLVLVDGENLLTRYEAMLDHGWVANPGAGVIHDRGQLLWKE